MGGQGTLLAAEKWLLQLLGQWQGQVIYLAGNHDCSPQFLRCFAKLNREIRALHGMIINCNWAIACSCMAIFSTQAARIATGTLIVSSFIRTMYIPDVASCDRAIVAMRLAPHGSATQASTTCDVPQVASHVAATRRFTCRDQASVLRPHARTDSRTRRAWPSILQSRRGNPTYRVPAD